MNNRIKKKVLAFLFAGLMLSAGLTGCTGQEAGETQAQTAAQTQEAGTGAQESDSQAQEESLPAKTQAKQEEQAGVVLPYSQAAQETYGLPEEFVLEQMPERIIVMTLGPTEILHELGVEMIAVPDTIDESQEWTQDLEAERLPFSANTMDTEGIIAMEPDMIIMSAGKRESYGLFFEEKGIPVYYTISSSMDNGAIDGTREQVELYGKGFGRVEEMNAILARLDALEADIAAWREENVQLQGQEMMILLDCPFTYTNNGSTTLGQIMASLGFVNMADSIEGLESVMGTGTLQISSEVIVEQNPPLIIAQPSGAGAGVIYTTQDFRADLEEEFADNAAVWGNVDAVKNQKILYLGTDDFPGTTGLGIFKCYEYLMENLPNL